MEPPSTQSPFARCRRYLHRRDVYRLLGERYLSLIALTDSCAGPVTSPRLRPWPSSRSLCRLLSAPAASRTFPTLSLRIFLRMPDPIPRQVPRSACACFFLRVIGLPHACNRSASPLLPTNTTFRGESFRGCRYSFMFRPPILLASPVVPTAAHTAAGQPRL